jgi:hypothetical protein
VDAFDGGFEVACVTVIIFYHPKPYLHLDSWRIVLIQFQGGEYFSEHLFHRKELSEVYGHDFYLMTGSQGTLPFFEIALCARQEGMAPEGEWSKNPDAIHIPPPGG